MRDSTAPPFPLKGTTNMEHRISDAVLPVAVYPPRGAVVHLYLEGYRPGAKRRSTLIGTCMCGASANESVPPPVGPAPTGRVHVPLREALSSDAFEAPKPTDPRPQWKWCGPCLGRAAQHYGLEALLFDGLLGGARSLPRWSDVEKAVGDGWMYEPADVAHNVMALSWPNNGWRS